MKVAIVLPPGFVFDPARPNSIETVVRTLSLAAPSETHIRVFCDERVTPTDGIATVGVDPTGGRFQRSRRIVAALRRWRPDFVELHQHAPTAAFIARALPALPSALYRHNFVKAPRGALDQLRMGFRYAPFAGHIFVSEAARSGFAKAFPKYAVSSFALPNPIDSALWYADPANRAPVIAFAGRAAPEKGLDLICAALDVALDRYEDWRAVLSLGDFDVHETWATPHLQRLHRFGNRVEIRRSQPLAVVRQILQSAAITLVPSVWAEPFGLAAIEAHAAGSAVISSGRGGLREASGDHALYLDRLTPETLAAAVGDLIMRPERRLALATGGQAFVERCHQPAQRALELEAIREQLIASHAAQRHG